MSNPRTAVSVVNCVAAAASYFQQTWRTHAIAGAAGVFLALVGAFGTGAASWLDRLTFWAVLLQAGTLCAGVGGAVATRRRRIGESAALRWLFTTLAVAAPMALLSWGLALLLFSKGAPVGFLFFAWASLLITAAMAALMMAINAPGPETRAAAPAGAKFRERLQPPFRGAEIFAVSAEDHYLRIHTAAGSTLILMRLSDALAELDGIEGAQLHRSWWVARGAILGARQDGRRLTLRLKGEIEAPVSRPNAKALRDSGWL